MSTCVRDLLLHELGALRHEPIDKRIRGLLGGAVVADTTRALLVWEPKRVVPTYAVPLEDLAAALVPAPMTRQEADGHGVDVLGDAPRLGDRVVLDPSVPFAVHTAEGESLTVRAGEEVREGAAFRLADSDLAEWVVLDFAAFDAWLEEDEPNVVHPRDPFHRIDVVRSSRRVVVERHGVVLAESGRPRMVFEPPLPPRCYLPPEDVRTDLLRPSATRSTCAYKGHATYWSLEDEPDVVWAYPEPLREAAELRGRLCFFDELVDVVVDGSRPATRPVTPWSRR